MAFAASATAAVVIGMWAVQWNRDRACTSRESPAEAFCARTAAGPAEAESLRARIARNPGDSNAYTQLALADRSERRVAMVEAASKLAPREPNLLLHLAAAAFDRRDWRAAVPPLVELQNGRDVPLAGGALAHIVRIGEGALLEPYVTPGSEWLPRVLHYLRNSPGAFSPALPLVTKALRTGVIDAQEARGYVRDLKASGAWADAYALWLSLHGTELPALFNASFDHAFEADGFDWEVAALAPARRNGVVVNRRRIEQRGSVLELQFNGRPVQLPMVRQYLFIGPGRYRIKGDYLAREFRSEGGLAWTVRCGAAVAGASLPLRETGGLWQPFEFEFTTGPDCALVAALQLETPEPAEAALGARGRVAFDAFSLERIAP